MTDSLCEKCVHYLVCAHADNETDACNQFKDYTKYVEVVHGRWVNAAGGRTICNHCGEYPLYDYFGRQKFSRSCPHCGAFMDDGERRNGDE